MATGYNYDAPWAEQTSGAVDAPATGKWKIYPLTTNVWVALDDADVEHTFAFVGAPATYTDLTVTGTAAFGAAATLDTNNVVNVSKSFGNIAATTRGISTSVTTTLSGNNANILQGGNFTATVDQNTFNFTAPVGVRGFAATAIASGASGTVTGMAALQTTLLNSGAGTVTNTYGINIPAAANSGGGVMTSIAGMAIADQTAATNNTLVLLGTATIPTGANWVIYSTSANNSSLAGALGLGGNFTPTNVLSLSGQAARTIWMERNTTSNTQGNNLTIQAGGATSAASNKVGGALILQAGVGTGNAVPTPVRLQASVKSASAGTTDRAIVDRFGAGYSKVLTDNSAIDILSVTAATLLGIGGIICYSIEVTDGTDVQMETGFAVYSGVNKGGAFTVSITEVNSQQSVSAGTLTTTWAISSANPALISVNANSSLVPSTGYPLITFSVENFAQQSIAIA